jgi:RNA polymerase sigma-70 factor (ECF subfamily)
MRGSGVEQSDDAEIYEKHAGDLVRYATVLAGPDQAQDVVSTVVLKVLTRRNLSDLDDPRAYLFRSVLNESRSWARTRKAKSLALSRLIEQEAFDGPESVIVERLTAADAVWKLSPRHRSAAYLVYWLDLPLEEAAHLMGVTTGAVKRYVHEVREQVRKEMQ